MRRLTLMLLVAALSLTLGGVADAHRLKYGKAKTAAQNHANAFAGQQTDLYLFVRENNHRFYGDATWTRVNPTGCEQCRWDPATGLTPAPAIEYCYVELNVRFKFRSGSRRFRTAITSSACF